MWVISKTTKIRDLGMEFDIFVLHFGICIHGIYFKIKMRFLRFLTMKVFVKSLESDFWGQTLSLFLGFRF